jgi:phosphohistidine phosphatase
MKKLILVRHAKSNWGDASISDHDRSLNERGLRNAPEMGKRLVKNGIKPQQILASSASRAQETARLIAAELDFSEGDILSESRLYEAQVTDWLEVIGELDDRWTSVMCIGHNPGVSDLAAGVFGQPVTDVPTCAVLTLDFAATYWSEVPSSIPAAADYDYPKKKPIN